MTTNVNTLGYIVSTGAGTSDPAKFQQLVTIDGPSRGKVISSCIGRQGPYFMTEDFDPAIQEYSHSVFVLPQPGGSTDAPYANVRKQEYTWRSKKFVLPGRTTIAVAKVVHNCGNVRLRIIADGCCRYEAQIRNNQAFKLPSQITANEIELELTGTATVYEVHVASSMQELLENE
jgi:hypothetical protein